MELSSHALYDHIINQVGRFINGIKNVTTQKKIIETFYQEICAKMSKTDIDKSIGSSEVYKFISDLVLRLPVLTIIIEQKTPELEEAIDLLNYHPIKVLEFQTLIREGVGFPVQAHLFEPSYRPLYKQSIVTRVVKEEITPIQKGERREKRVTAQDLIDANILKVGQIVYGWHHNAKYEGKVLNDGSIELLQTGKKFSSLNAAVYHIKGSEEDAWRWWLTIRENGSECVLDELRKEYRRTHTSNP
jgi:hypothetical protein